MNAALRALFESEGLMRYAVSADEHGEVTEEERGPLVAMGSGDGDYVAAPDPDENRADGSPTAAMTLDDYNAFLFHWLEAAAEAGDLRCANCGKDILPGDDLPDPDTWDAIFIEKELVAWMAVHFDCKRWLAKKLKGLHPFELRPGTPRRYDLSRRADAAATSPE